MFDECVPAGLRRDFGGHDVTTVQRMGWAGTANGALLSLVADAGFEAFLTVDRGIELQQRVASLPSALLAFARGSMISWTFDR